MPAAAAAEAISRIVMGPVEMAAADAGGLEIPSPVSMVPQTPEGEEEEERERRLMAGMAAQVLSLSAICTNGRY